MLDGIVFSLISTGFTFFMTILGSATVFLFSSNIKTNIQRIFLGFASGVMLSAAIWSLLLPSIQIAEEKGYIKWAPATIGFILGWIFLVFADYLIPNNIKLDKNTSSSNSNMMILAVTLHNIPEGLAVGLACSIALQEMSASAVTSAIVLSIGMGLQNFPEGAAISLPLNQRGMSKKKSFVLGCLSGVVEPISGVIGVVLSSFVSDILPFMLSFAAGAMIYVVVEELIPEATIGGKSTIATTGTMIGFLIMMILDTALS